MMILGMFGSPRAQTIEYIFKEDLRKTEKVLRVPMGVRIIGRCLS